MNKSTTKITEKQHSKSYKKRCNKCSGYQIKRDGFMRWKQRYRCTDCGYVFQNKTRINTTHLEILNKQLWDDYSIHKQTYLELSRKYRVSARTIQKRLDTYRLPIPTLVPTSIILLIDTTYFWDIGVMAFKDVNNKKIIHAILVTHESVYDYRLWVKKPWCVVTVQTWMHCVVSILAPWQNCTSLDRIQTFPENFGIMAHPADTFWTVLMFKRMCAPFKAWSARYMTHVGLWWTNGDWPEIGNLLNLCYCKLFKGTSWKKC